MMLIKTCGKSDDNMNSFVSFINIRNRSQQIFPEKANIILSGISSITADVESQKVMVGSVFDEDFQTIIKNSNTDKELYESIKLYSQRYLERNLSESEKAKAVAESERDNAISKVNEITQTIIQANTKLDTQKGRICQFTENKTKIKYYTSLYIIPALIVVLWMAYIVFVLLQLIACNTSWNFASKFFDYIKITTFGKGSSGPLYLIGLALFSALAYFVKKL